VRTESNQVKSETKSLWDENEKERHINFLELKAVYLGLRALIHDVRDTHVLIRSDSTTVVSCINHKGSSSFVTLDALAREIWNWCITRNLWISCAHIAGKDNVRADKLSRHFQLDTEWQLDTDLLQEALSLLEFVPNIDLFASKINR
jgi:ribonuclease HI